jgi:hypothetical protein
MIDIDGLDAATMELVIRFCGDPRIPKRCKEIALDKYVTLDEKYTIEAFQELIAAVIARIPPECRGSATVKIASGGDDYSGGMEIAYRRLETHEEMESRAAHGLEYARSSQAKERAEFERLKGKFTPTQRR